MKKMNKKKKKYKSRLLENTINKWKREEQK